MPFIQTKRITMHYEQIGHGPQAVVLVHGNLVSQLSWELVAQLLPNEQYTIFMPDMKGAGKTPETGDGHLIPEFAKDLASFVEALHLRDFHLVGHSMGGAISLDFVLNHPGFAKTLTMLDSVPAEGLMIPDEVLPLFEQMKADRKLFDATMLGTVPTADPDSPFIQRMLTEAFQSSRDVFLFNAKNCRLWNVENRLHEVQIPVLVIWGTLDTWIGREPTERMATLLPNCRLEIVDGVGHSSNMERPQEFSRQLQNFWGNA